MIELPRGPFGTIYADPPWPTGISAGKNVKWLAAMARRPYRTMTLKEIAELPVDQISARDAVLLMWCTWGNLHNAMFLMDEWKFNYATGMPWLKTLRPRDGDAFIHRDLMLKPVYGMGVWFQHCTELLLIGRRGKPFGSLGNPRPARKGIIISQRLAHSEKPEEVHLWIENGGFPKPWLEMFARRSRPGWKVWGDEVNK